jgi:DNA-binding MarR family transcriptional regulator
MSPETHPRHGLHPSLLSPIRLSIVAVLTEVERADFRTLGEVIEVSDSALSKNRATLEEAGLVSLEKGRINRRPRTWVRLTPAGGLAFDRHREGLVATVALRLPMASEN